MITDLHASLGLYFIKRTRLGGLSIVNGANFWQLKTWTLWKEQAWVSDLKETRSALKGSGLSFRIYKIDLLPFFCPHSPPSPTHTLHCYSEKGKGQMVLGISNEGRPKFHLKVVIKF